MIPREFFTTSGKAISPVSKLNAFDRALKNAGIAQCNLVQVSSILPLGCKKAELKEMPAGSIIYTVMARMDGTEGMAIGAGIAWAWEKTGKYGLVVEAHGQMDRKSLKTTLEWKMSEMAKIRGIEISNLNYQTEVLTVPLKNYGCALAALIYVL
ncbi:MAG: pyruvoyl-dependent arginine decarboxylase [Candidatus Bathyarchaeota archaeon]|nr:pyruvoyl-dependent arginine decarboxylase [Candidatus Bathyarchaeota archaeon]MDH5780279.1 pyruvoyl-dependent arginine decarboxylase [Candidatus Bathyarchaeota archaeon]